MRKKLDRTSHTYLRHKMPYHQNNKRFGYSVPVRVGEAHVHHGGHGEAPMNGWERPHEDGVPARPEGVDLIADHLGRIGGFETRAAAACVSGAASSAAILLSSLIEGARGRRRLNQYR